MSMSMSMSMSINTLTTRIHYLDGGYLYFTSPLYFNMLEYMIVYMREYMIEYMIVYMREYII